MVGRFTEVLNAVVAGLYRRVVTGYKHKIQTDAHENHMGFAHCREKGVKQVSLRDPLFLGGSNASAFEYLGVQ